MEEYISDVAGRVEENSTERPSDYYDEEGLLWCGVCKERKPAMRDLPLRKP